MSNTDCFADITERWGPNIGLPRCTRCRTGLSNDTVGGGLCLSCMDELFPTAAQIAREQEVYHERSYKTTLSPGAARPVKEGWVCPLCGVANAPWMPFCDCKKPAETVERTNRGNDYICDDWGGSQPYVKDTA